MYALTHSLDRSWWPRIIFMGQFQSMNAAHLRTQSKKDHPVIPRLSIFMTKSGSFLNRSEAWAKALTANPLCPRSLGWGCLLHADFSLTPFSSITFPSMDYMCSLVHGRQNQCKHDPWLESRQSIVSDGAQTARGESNPCWCV